MDIIWKGNENTNKSSRRGHIPIAIVNHITASSKSSAHSWFTTRKNKSSSCHFLVTKQGEIWQYVDIKDNAWCNGLSSTKKHYATSNLVKEYWDKHGFVNPNWFTVSIEHEALKEEELTERQYQATLNLHQYIIDEVKSIWGYTVPKDREHIIGHKEIDKVNKPFCPTSYFPYERLITDLLSNDENIDEKNNTEQIAGIKAIKLLSENKLLDNPQQWIEKDLTQPMPLWLFFDMFNKLKNSKKQNAIVTADTLNVREKPKGLIIGKVHKNDQLEIVDENSGWYRILSNQISGWVHGNYVKKSYK